MNAVLVVSLNVLYSSYNYFCFHLDMDNLFAYNSIIYNFVVKI